MGDEAGTDRGRLEKASLEFKFAVGADTFGLSISTEDQTQFFASSVTLQCQRNGVDRRWVRAAVENAIEVARKKAEHLAHSGDDEQVLDQWNVFAFMQELVKIVDAGVKALDAEQGTSRGVVLGKEKGSFVNDDSLGPSRHLVAGMSRYTLGKCPECKGQVPSSSDRYNHPSGVYHLWCARKAGIIKPFSVEALDHEDAESS